MTAVQEPISARVPVAGLVSLEGVSWETYERLAEEIDSSHIRITYDQGRMVLMSPLPRHERMKELIGQLLEMATLERNIPRSSFGSTTWRRRDLAKGLEPDRCYYIQHEPQVRGRDDLDLRRDPPPDLVIEVDISHHPMDRAGIYAALGVPEVWRFDGERVEFLKLSGATYDRVSQSVALPFITSNDINRFLAMFNSMDENSVLRAFREWLKP
jgi:Uma2 family endonuclease